MCFSRDECPLTKCREIDYLPDIHSEQESPILLVKSNPITINAKPYTPVSMTAQSLDLEYLSREVTHREYKKITGGSDKARGNKEKWERRSDDVSDWLRRFAIRRSALLIHGSPYAPKPFLRMTVSRLLIWYIYSW